MGSNMQRQAVPLLRTERHSSAPALEKTVARDSGVTIVARRDGVIESVDSTRSSLKADKPSGARDTGVDIYNSGQVPALESDHLLSTSGRSSLSAIRCKPATLSPTGPSTEMGELALGRNVVVALMPWGGYNFEDSILISERVVKEDITPRSISKSSSAFRAIPSSAPKRSPRDYPERR
jgi:DNA-directed RNA polymerase subunit beta